MMMDSRITTKYGKLVAEKLLNCTEEVSRDNGFRLFTLDTMIHFNDYMEFGNIDLTNDGLAEKQIGTLNRAFINERHPVTLVYTLVTKFFTIRWAEQYVRFRNTDDMGNIMYRSGIGRSTKDICDIFELGGVITIHMIQSHVPGRNFTKIFTDILKDVYENSVIHAACGYLLECDYNADNWAIVEKNAKRFQDQGFIDITHITGSEFSINMIFSKRDKINKTVLKITEEWEKEKKEFMSGSDE